MANGHWKDAKKGKEEILNVRREIASHRGFAGSVVQHVGNLLANPWFFILLFVFHGGWMVLNAGWLPIGPWDPYPFTFLATIASAEAPFLTLLILMRQERDRRIAELREETELQVSLYAERETTAVIRMLREMQEQQGMKSRVDVEGMDEPLDVKRIVKEIQGELKEEEGGPE